MHTAGGLFGTFNAEALFIEGAVGALELLHLPPLAPGAQVPGTADETGSSLRPPLLFIHGASHGAWCWEAHFMPHFAAHGWDCYAISLRGHGGSAGNLRGARIAHYGDDVVCAAAALPAPPILVGHSMGGFIIMKYLEGAARAPRPRAAVLIATIPTVGARALMRRATRRSPMSALRATLGWHGLPFIETLAKSRYYLLSDAMPDDEAALIHQKIGDESMTMLYDASVFALPNLKKIRAYCIANGESPIPLLLVAGERDRMFTVREEEKSATALGATYRLVPNIAHDIMLDIGWEAAAETIREWLETVR